MFAGPGTPPVRVRVPGFRQGLAGVLKPGAPHIQLRPHSALQARDSVVLLESSTVTRSGGTRVQTMSPAVERLVRLMLLLPSDPRAPLWDSAADDCGDLPTIYSIGGWVRDTAKMWPEGAPRTLAEMVLIAFGNPSDTTLHLLSRTLVGVPRDTLTGPGVGAAWAARARETAIDVLAEADSLEEVLERAKTDWS
jgi:hypothetical protein